MKLPWPTKKLEEICEFQNGIWKGENAPFEEVQVIRNVNFLERGLINWENIEKIPIEKKVLSNYLLKQGDLILERSGGGPEQPVGRVVFFSRSTGRYVFSNFTTRISVRDENSLNPKFLWAFLYHLYISGITKSLQSQTTGIRNLDFKAYKTLKIPLPPLPTQQKIVKILDTIQEAIEVQEKIIKTTKELKKSVMAEIFSSKFKIQNSKLQFKIKKWEALGNLVEEKIDYGISKKGHRSGKYPILRMNNLEDGKINTQDLQFVDLTEEEFKKFRLNKDEVIFNRTNSIDLVGKTALFDLDGDFVFASYLLRIRPKRDVILPEFLNYYFNFSRTQKELKSLASRGASQVNISAGRLATFKIPIFSIPEQREIVEILQTIDQKIELEQKKKELYEELFRTMLHKIMSQEIDIDLLGY